MGGSSPSTVNQPFNSASSQNQQMTGNLVTAGAQTFTPNAVSAQTGQWLGQNSSNLSSLWGNYPGQQIAEFDPTQEAALQQVYGAGTGLGGLVGQGQNAIGQGMYGTYQAGQGLTGEDVGSFYNPMAGNITAQMQNIFGQQNAQATGNAAKTAGGVGASRIGVAQGNLANQQALAAGQTYAGLYQNALQAAQQQKQQQLAAGQALASQGGNAIQTGMGGLNAAYQTGATRQAQEQAGLNAQYQQALGNFQAPFQIVAAQNAAMQGLGTLGGTTTQVGGQQGTQTGTMSATTAGEQSTQYPQPSLGSQIAGFGGLALGAAGLFLNRGGRTYNRGGRLRYASGGAAQSILPYTPMTPMFSGSAQRPTTPGPQGPVQSDLSAITGDIQKFVNLKNLYRKAPFANQKPGVTNQATPDISNYRTEQSGEGESPSNEYQEGGDVEADTQEQEDQPNWGRMLGLEDAVPMPTPRPATFDQRFGDLPPAQGEDVQTGEPPANFDERFGGDFPPNEGGGLTGQGVPVPLPRPAGAGVPLPMPRPAGAGTEAAPLRGGRGGGLGGVPQGGGGFLDRLSDPRRLALIQMGLGMAAASGQRDARGLPMSPLAVIGQGGSQGLQAYQKGAAQRTLEVSRLNQMAVAQQRQLEQVRHNKMLEQYYYGAPKDQPTPLPGIGAPGALVDAGEPEKVPEGKVPTMDAISLEPGGDRRRMDPPPPPPTGNYSSEAIATAGEQYAQTGKLPAGLSRDKEFRAAVMNYGGEVLKSRGITHSQAVEMWRFAPRQAGWIMGADGRQAGSMGTVIDHLDTLKELTRALKNGDNQTYNLIRNKYKKWTGENTPTDVETGAPIIGAEIMKAVGAAGAGTGAERETAGLNLGDLAKSPAQFEGAITTAQKLVAGQLRTKTRQAEAIGLPRERLDALVGKRAREVLDSLPAEGSEAPKTPLAPAQAKPALSGADQQALDWANSNPNDPRAAAIKQRLGIQ